ncbi:MAG: hypothetical protein AVDCRST_MAG54-1338, partial [uncultured Actinomycetospora sp.]
AHPTAARDGDGGARDRAVGAARPRGRESRPAGPPHRRLVPLRYRAGTAGGRVRGPAARSGRARPAAGARPAGGRRGDGHVRGHRR